MNLRTTVAAASVITFVAVGLAVFALTSGGSDEPAPLTQAQREDQFWTAYEQRLGLAGTDYADPALAKSRSIEYGHFLCDKLASGTDRDVLISQGSGRTYTREEMAAQVDTSVEFLCPDQR